MDNKKYIKIDELKIVNNKKIMIYLSYSKELNRYFNDDVYYIKYDENIGNIKNDILNIPALSGVLGPSWVLGADIYVDDIDRTYLYSLHKIRDVFKEWHPSISFNGEIHYNNLTENVFHGNGWGLLYSGGVDSTYSYYKHKTKNPHLFTIVGSEIPPNNVEYIDLLCKKYKKFAQNENVEISFIETNIRDIVNENRINSKYSKYLNYRTSWVALNIGVILTSLCAPLTVNKISNLIIASSYTESNLKPYGSHPRIDNNISWADVKIIHDEYSIDRANKIKRIKEEINKVKYYPTIRSCNYAPKYYRRMNCCKCEKCFRTITGLVLNGMDPEKFGFDLEENFFDILKQNIIKNKYFYEDDNIWMWKNIQNNITENMKYDLPGSKEFFEWYKYYSIPNDASKYVLRKRIKTLGFYFISFLPSSVRRRLRKIYNKV